MLHQWVLMGTLYNAIPVVPGNVEYLYRPAV